MIYRQLRKIAISISLCVLVLASAMQGQQIFKAAPQFATGNDPLQIVAADFNHDGSPDVATVNYVDQTVTVLLGDGKGGLVTSAAYVIGQSGFFPNQIAVTDLNNDGIPDIVATSIYETQAVVNVLLGKGDGTFTASSVAMPGANAMAIGDFNGDGKVDLILSQTWDIDTLSFYPGNGDGTFGSPILAPKIPASQLLGVDVNRDGKLDIVMVSSGRIGIELGNGDGTFQKPYFLQPAYLTAGILLSAVDVNGDGILDLLTVFGSSRSANGNVVTFLGKGDGTFQETKPQINLMPYGFGSIATGDFNGDGKIDMVVNNGAEEGILYFAGNGNGTFQPAVRWAGGGGNVVAADFNRDGKLDIASIGYGNTVSTLLGNGKGNFAAARQFVPPANPRGVYTGDFNEDGIADLAVITLPTSDSADASVQIMLGTKGGTFTPGVAYEAGSVAFSVAIADLNGDHHLDLAVANYKGNSVSVLLGNGNGTFQTKTDYALGGPAFQIAIADYNGDHKPDLAVATYGGGLYLLLGNGDGTFQPAVQVPGPDSTIPSIVAGDFNNDGKQDVVIGACPVSCFSSGELYMLLGNGDGTFQVGPKIGIGPGPGAMAAADLNHDGKLDLVVITTDCCVDPGYAFVLLANGDGTFKSKRAYSAGESAEGVVIADFNLDGNPDIVIGGVNASAITTLINKGDGTFNAGPIVPTSLGSQFLVVGDFNNDAKPDVAVLGNEGNPVITILLNQVAPK